MSDKIKISELEESTQLYEGCCFPIVTYGETKKVKFDTLRQQIKDEIEVDGKIAEHNISPDSHHDIRTAIIDLENEIPDQLLDLSDDPAHRTVTDDEKAAWNDKISNPTSSDVNKFAKARENGNVEWVEQPSEEEITEAVSNWLEEHPEATTTVQDGAITEQKLAQSLIDKRMKYSVIVGKTVTPSNGYYIYEDCLINDISSETILSGDHIFKNCTIGTLFVKGGTYEFHNCTFDYIKAVNTRVRCFSCTGKGINLIGNCDDSIVDGCNITAETMGCVVISGGLANNVKIANNVLLNNQSASISGIVNLECINTHGVKNSVIENNYCVVDTDRYAIDISGHGSEIRSYNNVLRNNIVQGGKIVAYATKDFICCGNKATTIEIGGEYLDEDYGEQWYFNNFCNSFNIANMSGSPTMNVFICNNICIVAGVLTYYAIPENLKVMVFNNTIKGMAVNNNSYGADVQLSEEMVYIPANSKLYLPMCYVVATEISSLTANSFYNGGVVANDTNLDRYVIYRKTNIKSGQTRFWNQ